ncbi:MAG: DUF4157 domain-containing protein, partial [Betaproteobacteria bacterium]|nr:DUF4157 domain-containing protein [Betaproteobacteria bacterium]
MAQEESKFNQPEGGSVPLPLRGRSSDLNLPVQRRDDEEKKLIQEQFAAAQRGEKEEPLRGKFVHQSPAQLEQQPAAKTNDTGLPNNLKSGIESLSGMSMDNVKVHYNSSQPAQLNALAYAQGTDIHVASGQEQHLPHEAWHVVQQAQGRVKPTMQMKEGVTVNDDPVLEQEADMMGAKAVTPNSSAGFSDFPAKSAIQVEGLSSLSVGTIQGMFKKIGIRNSFWIDTETGIKYKQVEVRIDNKMRLQISDESAAPFYVYWIDSKWQMRRDDIAAFSGDLKQGREEPEWIDTETSIKYKQVKNRVDNRVRLQIFDESAVPFYAYLMDGEWQTKERIYSDALELGYEVGLQVKNEQDKENYIKLCFTRFSEDLKGDKTIGLESLEQQYRLGVKEGIDEIAKDYQVNNLENPEEGSKVHNESVRKTELKGNVSKVLINAQNDIFIPEIKYRDKEVEDEVEDEDDYDPLTWQASQKEENLKVAGAVDQHVSSEVNEKVVEILFHVIKAGISSDRAIYAPKEWTNDVLPKLPAENKKAIAADVFSTWMSGKEYLDE